MKHLGHSVLAALMGLGAATAAQAGGPAPAPAEPMVAAPAPAPVPGTDWTGFYAGLQLGFGESDASGAATGDADGALGGVHAGYNWDFGNYVVGAELSYDASDIKQGGGGTKVDNLARLKLRVGADMGQNLVYAAGGPAWMDISTPGAGSSDDNGWFLGAGLEHALRENMTLGGEILYHQFDNFSKSGVDYEVLTIQARVSFRF
ncbi:MAG: outer membrane protein [Paracoccaceae bacterium]